MSRLLASWRTYWFTPASLTTLGVARLVLVTIIFFLNGRTRFLRVAMVAPQFWAPIGLVQALGMAQPSLATMQWMATASTMLLLAAGLGLGARVALAVLFPLLLVQEALLNSLGKVSHGTIPLLYAVLFFALAPCDRGFGLGAVFRRARAAARGEFAPEVNRQSAYARWPLELLFIQLAAFYFLAGRSKVRVVGLRWADGYTLQFYLLALGMPAGYWLASHLWLCTALSVLVLVFELGFPLGIVFRRLRPLIFGGGVLFHLGNVVFLGPTFWMVAALYLLYVPWARLGTAVARWTGLARRRLDVVYDGGCPLCLRSMSVIRDLDMARTVRFVDLAVRDLAAHPRLDPAAVRGAMHVIEPGGRVYVGFDAFRRLVWVLPAGWPLVPLLYLPGVPACGRLVYGWVAVRRLTTTCPLHRPARE